MITKEEIEKFLFKNVSIGVPHLVCYDKLFFYYGILIEVNNTEIKLRTNNGFKIVLIENIQDIHITPGGQR